MMNEKQHQFFEFIKENIVILTSIDYDREQIKFIKKNFFVELHKNKFGKPSDREIALGVIQFLKDNGKIKSIEDIRIILNHTPFLSKNIYDLGVFSDFFNEKRAESSILTSEDLSKLNQANYLRKKEKEMQEKIIKEKAEIIEQALDRKRKEYESFPSVLDSSDFVEPEEKKICEEEHQEWWQILGLSSDPFPRQEGLDKIPESIYEKVIYKSVLIQEYIKKIESNRDKILNKGIWILGNFGTGKTTFFDYLTYYLVRNKICALRLTINPKADIFSYSIEFETKLYALIKKIYCDHHGPYCNGPPTNENSKKLMLALKEKGWSFMIIIDDLHKHIGFEDIVLNFLSVLQIVKDDFIRSGIDIGFLVAGIPSWELKMKRDGALPGFFDTAPEIIPEVSAEAAYSVINNRLSAYSINQKRKSVIGIEWVNQIHRKIKNEGLFVNYRILIDEVIKELKNKNFNILEANYLEIPEKELSLIKDKLTEYSVMELLTNLFGNPSINSEENKIQCFNLIIQLYMNTGINETESEFLNFKFHFKKLLDSKIILKQKQEIGFKWVLNPKIIEAFDSICNEYNLFPQDYLKNLFFLKERTPQKIVEKTGVIEALDLIIKKYGYLLDNSINELLSNSLSAIIQYEKTRSEEIDTKKYEETAKLLVTSLAAVSKAIFLLQRKSSFPIDDKDILESWKDYWFCPNALANFINEVWYNKTYPDREKAGYVYLYFEEASEELIAHLIETLELNSKIVLPYNKLKKEEIKILDKIRKDMIIILDGKSYFDIVQIINNLIENKIRTSFFNQFNLVYGEIKNRLTILGDLKLYIEKKGVAYDNYFFNEFHNLNRGEYKKLILENTKLKKQYFRFLFKDWGIDELENFLNIFCETNIIISHLKIQKITQDDQACVFRFLLNSINFITSINSSYLKFIDEYFYFSIKSDEVICYFSLPGMKEVDNKKHLIQNENEIQNSHEIAKVAITLNEINRVYDKLTQFIRLNKNYALDLEDFELIYNLFSIEYRKFVAIIALLVYRTKTKQDDKLKLMVRPFFGSEVILSFD